MEIEKLGIILSVVGLVFTILGGINTILLLYVQAELRSVRKWVDYNTSTIKGVEQRFQNCQIRCREDQKILYRVGKK